MSNEKTIESHTDSSEQATVSEVQKVQKVPDNFPEGGLRAWLTVFGGVMAAITTVGSAQSYGVYQAYYARTYLPEYTASQISWVGSLQLCLLYAVGLISGRLFDTGYFRPLLAVGSFLFVFSSFMLSLAKPNQYYQIILSQGIGMGLGSGIIFLPSLSVPAHYFRRRRAVAMGLVVAGGALGAVIYTILLNELFGPLGFGWAVRVSAFLNLLFLGLANLTMKTRLPPRASFGDIKVVLTDLPYWFLVAGLFFGFWGSFFPFFYLQVFAQSKGVSESFLTWVIPIMNAGSVFGRMAPNFLSDKYGPLNVIIPCNIISAVLLWALLGVNSIAGVTVFGVLYGFFSGGFLTIAAPALASTSLNLTDVGLRIGVACFVISIGLLTGNPIGGALLSPPKDSWWRPLTFAFIVMAAGTVCLVISRQYVVRRKGRQFV